MNNIHLISFADSSLHRTKRRFIHQAKEINVFCSIEVYDEGDISEVFYKKHSKILNKNVRGFGFWVWKYDLIFNKLLSLADGEFLIYLDAGCHINNNGKNTLYDYLSLLNKENKDLLFFKYDYSHTTVSGFDPVWSIEKYTKKDVLHFFDVYTDSEIRKAMISAGGILIIKKSFKSLAFYEKMYDLALDNFYLFNDDINNEDSCLVAHRHDQSVISILALLNNNVIFKSGFEHWLPLNENLETNWSLLRDFPFLAKRDLDLGLILNIKRKLAYIFRHDPFLIFRRIRRILK